MFTATPCATRSDLALSGKKQKTIPRVIPRCSGGFPVRNLARRNFLFFPQSEHKRHWGRVRDNTTHLSSCMKSSLSCSY